MATSRACDDNDAPQAQPARRRLYISDFYNHETGAGTQHRHRQIYYVTVKTHSPLFNEQYRVNYFR